MKEQIPLIILGSARKQSDTHVYVDFVFTETEHHLLDLLEYNISSYNYDGNYPPTDNFDRLTEELLRHDTIVFATPVYWYAMSAFLKNMFDRLTDLVTIQKESGRKLKGKSVLLLAVGADLNIPEGFEIPFHKTAEYLGMHYKGCVYFSTEHQGTEENNARKRQDFLHKIT